MKKLRLTFFLLLSVAFSQAQQANYDENKVGQYTLPDPLISSTGSPIKSSQEWERLRRPEVLALFQDQVYGKLPQDFDEIQFVVKKEQGDAMNGAARLKEIEITISRRGESVTIELTLFTPNRVHGAVPAFLLINNRGEENTSASREVKSGFWPAERVIDAGYAVAAFQVNDAAPDDKDSYQNAVLRLYPELIKADNGMKAIGSWAWAASRIMDYFESDRSIDAAKVALVGHSRGGKASLWAAAEDPRFALCISNNSGNTGAALSKRNFGETVSIINTSFPHWFTTNYKAYNDREDLLPVDQHLLLALIAPRPVYATSASDDLWADPTGTYLALKEAAPVYALYDRPSQLPDQFPALNEPLFCSPLAYHIREGKHDMTEYDWEQFIKFATFHFSKAGSAQ